LGRSDSQVAVMTIASGEDLEIATEVERLLAK
jgi:hypothetical protein